MLGFRPQLRLPCLSTTVDKVVLTGAVGGGLAKEEHGHASLLLWLAEAAKRDKLLLLVVEQVLVHALSLVGGHVAWGEGVEADGDVGVLDSEGADHVG